VNDRLTKQGIRNLNPVGHNGHRNAGKQCRHHFAIRLIIGTRWTIESYEEPVYGRKCLWCPTIREEIC